MINPYIPKSNTSAVFESLYENDQIVGEVDFVENSGNPYKSDHIGSGYDHGTRVLATMAGFFGENYIGVDMSCKDGFFSTLECFYLCNGFSFFILSIGICRSNYKHPSVENKQL